MISKRVLIIYGLVIVTVSFIASYGWWDNQRAPARYFPREISIGKNLVHDFECTFWCIGGSIYQLSEKQAGRVKIGGVEFLNELPLTGRNNRPIDRWTLSLIHI